MIWYHWYRCIQFIFKGSDSENWKFFASLKRKFTVVFRQLGVCTKWYLTRGLKLHKLLPYSSHSRFLYGGRSHSEEASYFWTFSALNTSQTVLYRSRLGWDCQSGLEQRSDNGIGLSCGTRGRKHFPRRSRSPGGFAFWRNWSRGFESSPSWY